MKKIILIVFLSCSLLSINYMGVEVIAQTGKWQRVQGGRIVSGGAAVSAGGTSAEYFIASGDKIDVFVWQNPDLSKMVRVGPDGKISYPLVGRIRAVGLSVGQLEDEIREKLSKYIRSPQVSIMIKEFAGNKIVILGEVNFPGMYTFTGTINLIEVIAEAGDFTGQAYQDSVIVVHGNLTDNPEVIRVNVSRVLKKGTSQRDIVLRPNDVVYVPRSFIHDIAKFVNNFQSIVEDGTEIMDLRKAIMTKSILR